MLVLYSLCFYLHWNFVLIFIYIFVIVGKIIHVRVLYYKLYKRTRDKSVGLNTKIIKFILFINSLLII